MDGDKEIKTLTGLRGIAALVVMLYHFFYSDHAHTLFIGRGYLAVDLFFVLSGFVMALSYGHLFAERVSIDSYRYFLIKRLARVYPLLFFITAVALVQYIVDFSGNTRLSYAGYGLRDFMANLLMIQAWGLDFIGMPASTWSISTEFFAYLVFPLLIFTAMHTRGMFPALMVVAAVLGIGLCALSPYGSVGALDITSRDNPFPLVRCLSGFCLGLVAYRLARQEGIRRRLASGGATLAVLSCLVVALILQAPDLVIFFLYPFLVAALYGNSAAAKRLFANRLAYHLGVLSYSMYLIHPQIEPTSRKVETMLTSQLGNAGHLLGLLSYMAAVYVASLLCYRFIESPGRKYINHLSTLRRPAAIGD